MSDRHRPADSEPGSLSSADVDRLNALNDAIARERAKLTPDEIAALRVIAKDLTPDLVKGLKAIAKEYEMREWRRENLRKNWPQIAFVLTVGGGALWTAFNWVAGILTSLKGAHP